VEALRRVKSLAKHIKDKKGEDILLLNLRKISPITDYFVIATGLSSIHTRAIADSLIEKYKPHHCEGIESAKWILLDYLDFIIHIFTKETREFYGLERLWGDAPRIDIDG